MSKKIDDRSKIWNVVFYPESAPSYFLDVIRDSHVSAALSPIHNMDRWTEKDEVENPEHKAGDYKKPHYHLHLHYDGNKSQEQVFRDFCEPLNTGLQPKISNSDRNDTRYLIHLDNDDKVRYRLDECRFFNGFDVKDYFDYSEEDKKELVIQVEDFIYDNKITEYAKLIELLKREQLTILADTVRHNSLHFNYLCKSWYHGGFQLEDYK